MAIVALIPIRNGKRLVPSAAPSSSLSEATSVVGPNQHDKNLQPLSSPLPWIPLSSSFSSTSTTVVSVVGRRELLTCLWKACGCHDDVTTSRHKCDACQLVNTWALSALSRHMLQFQIAAPNSMTTTAETLLPLPPPTVHLWIRGRHVDALLDIRPKPQLIHLPKQMQTTTINDGDHDWIGPWTLAPHTTLRFQPSSEMAENDNASNVAVVHAALSFELVQVDAQSGQVLEDAPPQMSSLSSSCTTTLEIEEDPGIIPALPDALQSQGSTTTSCTTTTNDLTEEQVPSGDNRADNQSGNVVIPSPPKEMHFKSPGSAQDAINHQSRCCDDTAEAGLEFAIRSRSEIASPTNQQSEEVSVEMDPDDSNDESKHSHQSDHGDSQETYTNETDDDFSGWQTQGPLLPPPIATSLDALAQHEKMASIELSSSPVMHEQISSPVSSPTEGEAPDCLTSDNRTTNQGGDEKMRVNNLHATPETNGQALPISSNPTFSEPVAKKERVDQVENVTVIAKPGTAHGTEPRSVMHPMEPVKCEPSNPLESDQHVDMAGSNLSNNAFAPTLHHSDLNQIDGPAHTVPSNRPLSPNQQQDELHQPQQPILYFVRRGGLSQKRIQLLSKNARSKGALVLDRLSPIRPKGNNSRTRTPTHLVLEPTASVSALLSEVQLSDEDALREWLQQNEIQCVTTAWITKGDSLELPPPPTSRWYKLSPQRKRPTSSGGQQNETDEQNKNETRKRPRSESRPVTPSFDDDDQNGTNDDEKTVPSSPKGRNAKLSELFLKLSKLHQSCPLLAEDAWKAYSFHVTAGRLRHLEFEIRDDPALLAKVRQIRGFGDSSLRMIQEYLSSGTFQRIDAFEADPDRIAMKRMMAIWGVGRVKASELVRQGYKDIAQVRKGLESRKLDLDRNQRIGVECYEDILEEMDRSEVETIGSIVAKAAQEIVPGVEAMIMGSYRRGKPGCGDVDVFLTHKDHFDQIPPTALGRIVDKLREWGHIAFHLTHLQGVKSSDDSGKRYWSNKPPEKDISTYFGVFHSPVVNGKRRRVDIKFFPYRERVFAALYFTGNGFFNRSMRLWASRKFKWLLNEKGLFTRDMRMRVLEADTERQVFDHLRLVYKEPHERDCFDAVQPVDDSEDGPLDVSRAEISKDDNEHRWID